MGTFKLSHRLRPVRRSSLLINKGQAMAAEERNEGLPGPERPGPEQYAPRHRRGPNVVEVGPNSFEAEIHELVRRGIAQPQKRIEAESPGDPITKNVNLLIGRTVSESFGQIDHLIGELQGVRNMLQREGERVNREVASYVSLNHAVRTAVKTIGETLTQWRSPGQGYPDQNGPGD